MFKKLALILLLVVATVLVVPTAGMAENVTLTGTVTPQSVGISISPTVLDLSGKAGELIQKSFTITNIGGVPVGIQVDNFTADVGGRELVWTANAVSDQTKAYIGFGSLPAWTLPGGQQATGLTFNAGKVVAKNLETAYYDVTLPVRLGGYSIAPSGTLTMTVQLFTHQTLPSAANVSGTISISAVTP